MPAIGGSPGLAGAPTRDFAPPPIRGTRGFGASPLVTASPTHHPAEGRPPHRSGDGRGTPGEVRQDHPLV
ncbi:hypothetical protein GCM10027360_11900 [Amycolatopsis echigonensis]